MKRFAFPMLLIFILAACAPSQAATDQTTPMPAPVSTNIPTPTDDPALIPTLFPNAEGNDEMTRTDEQGAVVFSITPLNLGTPADNLEFEVSMNTHSVELVMDLAVLSTLTTDAGVSLQATKWEATPGGHHVSGTLIFPAMQNGKSILDGASKLTLTIVDVDAASRIFDWQLK